ncbi:hypothetical protein ACSBL2_10445 [Pedobacter sp. AW31-3R]|uniref:hypothetical protein n=1 Tax=Pedobacter sp. AW31-3R TaxID=3445781 RepID=UPI003F9EE14D
MKTQISNLLKVAGVALLMSTPALVHAQNATELGSIRAYDKSGINVFEAPKDSVNKPFDKIKINWGAGFVQGFQNLKHSNTNGGLYKISPGFNTANANLYMDIQLGEGIRMNLTSYLAARHHNETWVKGGYIQFNKLPFEGEFWDEIMKYVTIQIGHTEINYGDQHFRRTDGGNAIYNPFIENYIMDAFNTEIGGEVYVRKGAFFGMVGVGNGTVRGYIDSLVATPQDGNIHKNPSLYFKAGVDKQVNPDVRLRLSGSFYNQASSSGNSLYSGDRTGSNYYMPMEPVTGTYAANATSGRFNPGFTKNVNAAMVNGFAKVKGFEVFATYEQSKGRNKNEISTRKAEQYAIEGIYRFTIGNKLNENLFIGARYNTVSARLANVAATATTAAITYNEDVNLNRYELAGGWFLTKNILLKGEYVNQKYKDYPTNTLLNGGKFHGYVIHAVVGF